MFDPRELATALHAGEVDYVIIGGLAVAAHGYARATKDLDIVPSPEPANLDRLARVLRTLDGQLYGIGDFEAAEFPFDPLDPAQLPRAATSSSQLGTAGSISCNGCRGST